MSGQVQAGSRNGYPSFEPPREVRTTFQEPDAPSPEEIESRASRSAICGRNAVDLELSGTPGDSAVPEDWQLLSIEQFLAAYPKKRPPIIDGLLREGETCNVIGAAKAGKSWLIIGLLVAIALGRDWLGHHTRQGRVLLIDNELQAEEISARLRTVTDALEIDPADLDDQFDIISLRGKPSSIDVIRSFTDNLQHRDYSVVALDSFYRILPLNTSENDNAQITAVYNVIDSIAEDLGSAVILNHHSTKGDQSGKSITDVGSGAGAISRAADTHLIIRPHALEACAVMDGVCRSFPPVEPKTILWKYPLWRASEIEPELKQRKTAREAKQEANDREAKATILNLLKERETVTVNSIVAETGMGPDRTKRVLGLLTADEQVQVQTKKTSNALIYKLKSPDPTDKPTG